MPRPRNNQFLPETFYFHRADPGSGLAAASANDADNWKIQFEAHIVSIDDSSSPAWSENFDMGRADPTMMYTSMNRSLSVSFQVIAMNKEEQESNHEYKLARLGKMTYPIYKNGYGYNAPHVYFQIGQLYKGYGVLTAVNYNWTGDNVWIDGRPMITDCSVSIRVLGDSQGKRPSINSRYFI